MHSPWIIERRNGEVSDVRLVKSDWSTPLVDRLTPNTTPIDFGAVTTSGAVRCDVYEDRVEITPLPLEGAMTALLNLNELTSQEKFDVASFEAIDLEGNSLGAVSHQFLDESTLGFATTGTEFRLILNRQ